ncbi:hypothetical protein JB92DRAFT_1305707 [Gautieria morchelliformis]|nr:hypothetical protein JB92DRAFT_1305707 [Gautieria morchelliformis]
MTRLRLKAVEAAILLMWTRLSTVAHVELYGGGQSQSSAEHGVSMDVMVIDPNAMQRPVLNAEAAAVVPLASRLMVFCRSRTVRRRLSHQGAHRQEEHSCPWIGDSVRRRQK